MRIGIVLLAALAAAVGSTACGAQAAGPVTWDLARQYPSDDAWNAAFAEVQNRGAIFAKLRGAPIASASRLADLLDEAGFLRGRAGNLARFALLNATLDKTDTAAKTRLDAATGLETRVEADVSWLDGAVSALGRDRLIEWRGTEPRLARHGWALHTAMLAAGHNYPAGSETAFAALERASLTSGNLYDQLMSSDLGWAKIADEQGTSVTLDPDTYPSLAASRNTAVRRAANDAFYGHLKALEQPLGLLLTRRYEIDRILARARNFDNGTDAFFALSDGVPSGTYRRMIAVTRANRATLVRYARLVARLNNIPDMRYADLAIAPPDIGRTFTLDESKNIALKSLAPLGARYQQTLRRRLASPWFDFANRPHKDSGALGVYWQVGGGHPYGIVTYANGYVGSRTVASVAALTMFYADIPPDKAPLRREQDFPIYGNAMWYLGALLQIDHLLDDARSKQDRIGLRAANIARLWGRFVQGVVATDFEARLEDAVAAGKPPSGNQIDALYLSVLKDYYGDAALAIPQASGEEWMTLGTAYYGHVSDEWAFAMAGAAAMAERVKAHDASAIAAIASPMARADSYLSYDLFRDAGADLTAASTYEAVFRRMNADMDALDRELK
jgi:oligoendopeptidase F